jgi:hypothetical protein
MLYPLNEMVQAGSSLQTLFLENMGPEGSDRKNLQRMDSNVREKATFLSASLTLNDSIGVNHPNGKRIACDGDLY